jgi:hypothetical protein
VELPESLMTKLKVVEYLTSVLEALETLDVWEFNDLAAPLHGAGTYRYHER